MLGQVKEEFCMDCFINMASCNISQEAQVLHLPPPPPLVPLRGLFALNVLSAIPTPTKTSMI